MVTTRIQMDVNKKLYIPITAKQGDSQTRYLEFQIVDGSIPVDISIKSVRCYMKKPDGTEVFSDLVVNDGAKGIATLELTKQMLAISGNAKCEIIIADGYKKLSSIPFELNIVTKLMDDGSIASSNEYSALENALNNVQNIEKPIKELNAKLDEVNRQINDTNTNLTNLDNKVDKRADWVVESYKWASSDGNNLQYVMKWNSGRIDIDIMVSHYVYRSDWESWGPLQNTKQLWSDGHRYRQADGSYLTLEKIESCVPGPYWSEGNAVSFWVVLTTNPDIYSLGNLRCMRCTGADKNALMSISAKVVGRWKA